MSLYIKNFNPDLHKLLKITALQKGKLLSELVEQLLRDALQLEEMKKHDT